MGPEYPGEGAVILLAAGSICSHHIGQQSAKLAMMNGERAAEKAKNYEPSSDDSDVDNRKKKPVFHGKAASAEPVQKKYESSNNSDREEEKPAAKPAATAERPDYM